jgi:hypothetical protein
MPQYRRLLPVLLLLASGVAAGESVSPESFERLAEGRTLRFTLDGVPFGAEQYFSGRRSLWRFEDGSCEAGEWWPEGDLVCFRYEAEDGPAQCWRFRQAGGRYEAARIEDGRESGFVLRLSQSDTTPLDCPGPSVGS